MGIVGFGSFLAKHSLYHTGLLHNIPGKAKEITGLPQARCGIDGDAASMEVRFRIAKTCPQWDAVWLSRVIASTLRRHAGVFRDAGFDFVKVRGLDQAVYQAMVMDSSGKNKAVNFSDTLVTH